MGILGLGGWVGIRETELKVPGGTCPPHATLVPTAQDRLPTQ